MLLHTKTLWWPYLKANRSASTLVVASGVIASVCNLLVPLCIANFLQLALGAAGNRTRALNLIGFSPAQTLPAFFLFFGAVILLRFSAAWFYEYRLALLGEGFTASLRSRLVKQAVEVSAEERQGGRLRLLSAVTGESKTLERLLTKGVIGFIRHLFFLGLGMYLLFALAASVTGVLLTGMAGLYLLQHRHSRKLHPLIQQHRRAQRRLMRTAAQASDPAIFADDVTRRFRRRSLDLQQRSKQLRLQKALLRAATPLLLHALLALLFLGLATGYLGRGLSTGDVVAYVLLLLTLFPVFRDLLRIGSVWVAGAVAARRWLDVDARRPMVPA